MVLIWKSLFIANFGWLNMQIVLFDVMVRLYLPSYFDVMVRLYLPSYMDVIDVNQF